MQGADSTDCPCVWVAGVVWSVAGRQVRVAGVERSEPQPHESWGSKCSAPAPDVNLHRHLNVVQLAELSELFHVVTIGHDHVVANEVGGSVQFMMSISTLVRQPPAGGIGGQPTTVPE